MTDRIKDEHGRQQDCKFFGARTQEKRESTNRCKDCLTSTPSMYKSCTIESNKLIMTPVGVGSKPADEEMNDNEKSNVKEKKMSEDTPIQSKPVTPKVASTAGVLGIAKKMLAENKSTEEIMTALIAEYQKAGKNPRQAKHNAQSCLFNARKKLQPKAQKADPTRGTDREATTPTAQDAEAKKSDPTIATPSSAQATGDTTPATTEGVTEAVVVPIDKGPELTVEVEETNTNGTLIEDGGETEV